MERRLAISLFALPSAIRRQYPDFTCRQRIIRGVLGKLEGDFGGDRLPTGVHGPNRVEQLQVQGVLEKVGAGARLERAQRLHVAGSRSSAR